jgi:small GTP-binding protein
LEALGKVVELGEGRLGEPVLRQARRVVKQAGERMALSGELTVVALVGPTGAGKSSLFNALTKADHAEVSVRRPTTSAVRAATWGGESPAKLLDWLDVGQRHRLEGGDAGFSSLVLLDMPDYDSVESKHRQAVDRLVGVVDAMIWVVDPEKYADSSLHDDYIKAMAGYSEVMMVAFNKSDQLSEADASRCVKDLRRLLDANAAQNTPIIATSTLTGAGVDALREVLARVVGAKVAMARRLGGDVSAVRKALDADLGPIANAAMNRRVVAELHESMKGAAYVPVIAAQIEEAVRKRGFAVTGWPFTSRRAVSSAAILKKLAKRQSIPLEAGDAPTFSGSVQRARVDQCLRDFTNATTGELSDGWARSVRAAATSGEDELIAGLNKVAATQLAPQQDAWWWHIFQAVQWLCALACLAGLLWAVGGLFLPMLGYPGLPAVTWLGWPAAAWLFVGGLVVGTLSGLLGRALVAPVARRAAKHATDALETEVHKLVSDRVLTPVQAEFDRYLELVTAVKAV